MRKIGDKVVIALEELEQLREMAREVLNGFGRGAVIIERGDARWVEVVLAAKHYNPGTIVMPCGNKPIVIATGEGPALEAEEWSEVLISKITLRDLRIADILDSGVHSYTKVTAILSEELGEEILVADVVEAQGRLFSAGYRIKEPIHTAGGDPAAMERDPDAEEVDAETVECYLEKGTEATERRKVTILPGNAAQLIIGMLPEHTGEGEARGRCEAEGREYARGRLVAGATVAEIRRNMIEPNPYPGGTPERVWWGWGFLLELQADIEQRMAAN